MLTLKKFTQRLEDDLQDEVKNLALLIEDTYKRLLDTSIESGEINVPSIDEFDLYTSASERLIRLRELSSKPINAEQGGELFDELSIQHFDYDAVEQLESIWSRSNGVLTLKDILNVIIAMSQRKYNKEFLEELRAQHTQKLKTLLEELHPDNITRSKKDVAAIREEFQIITNQLLELNNKSKIDRLNELFKLWSSYLNEFENSGFNLTLTEDELKELIKPALLLSRVITYGSEFIAQSLEEQVDINIKNYNLNSEDYCNRLLTRINNREGRGGEAPSQGKLYNYREVHSALELYLTYENDSFISSLAEASELLSESTNLDKLPEGALRDKTSLRLRATNNIGALRKSIWLKLEHVNIKPNIPFSVLVEVSMSQALRSLNVDEAMVLRSLIKHFGHYTLEELKPNVFRGHEKSKETKHIDKEDSDNVTSLKNEDEVASPDLLGLNDVTFSESMLFRNFLIENRLNSLNNLTHFQESLYSLVGQQTTWDIINFVREHGFTLNNGLPDLTEEVQDKSIEIAQQNPEFASHAEAYRKLCASNNQIDLLEITRKDATKVQELLNSIKVGAYSETINLSYLNNPNLLSFRPFILIIYKLQEFDKVNNTNLAYRFSNILSNSFDEFIDNNYGSGRKDERRKRETLDEDESFQEEITQLIFDKCVIYIPKKGYYSLKASNLDQVTELLKELFKDKGIKDHQNIKLLLHALLKCTTPELRRKGQEYLRIGYAEEEGKFNNKKAGDKVVFIRFRGFNAFIAEESIDNNTYHTITYSGTNKDTGYSLRPQSNKIMVLTVATDES